MGPVSAPLYLYEDPWRASAFFFAFLQLVLTVLVLVHTVIVCITFQLMRWYGWGYLSCHDGICQRDATVKFESGVSKRPLNSDRNASRRTPSISTEFFLKRSQSEDRRAVRSRSVVCPKCYGVWNLRQGVSFRYDKGATTQLRETPTFSDADNSPLDALGSNQKFLKSELAGKLGSGAVEVRHGRLHFGGVNFHADNNDTTGDSESCSNTPVHDLPRPGKEAATESAVYKDALREEVASSSKEPRGTLLSRVSFKSSARSEGNSQSSEFLQTTQKEKQEEIMDEDFAAVPSKEDDNKKVSYESEIKGLCILKDVDKGYDSESVIKGLREAVLKEREKLCTLYVELEIERISSETATNEAMSMISRLQEEKAALRMQAAHYRRIAEERAIYDEQAMQVLRDILVKKEKENFLLEKEVQAIRTRCCRNMRIYGKKRQGADTPGCCGMLSLKNKDAVDGVCFPGRKKKESGGELPFLPLTNEKQPFKRLKGNMDYEKSSQLLFLASGVHSNTQSASSGGNETHVHNACCSCEHRHSAAFAKNNCEEVFDNGLVIQEKSMVSEGEHVLCKNEKLLIDSENKNESVEGLSSSTFATSAESVQRLRPFLPSIIEEDIAKKEIVENQFGESSLREREAVGLEDGAPRYSKEVCSSVPACTEVGGFASTDVIQFHSMVLDCNTRKDLQARGEISPVHRLPQSCPSSVNHTGSASNNIEESNSSLLGSHVH
ncbi:hypothetical protein L7F22_030989 [Adiantum nelumboides]|nr:hypothetical protein [Adiantum nelumboides]